MRSMPWCNKPEEHNKREMTDSRSMTATSEGLARNLAPLPPLLPRPSLSSLASTVLFYSVSCRQTRNQKGISNCAAAATSRRLARVKEKTTGCADNNATTSVPLSAHGLIYIRIRLVDAAWLSVVAELSGARLQLTVCPPGAVCER